MFPRCPVAPPPLRYQSRSCNWRVFHWMASVLRESKHAPSTFAALLRSSKFASFDPKISQIYTTFDGHAHRGNWGLKRPLALKRKNGGFIIVNSVDSREQQTEWFKAEQEARWMNAFSELGKDVDVRQDTDTWYDENMGDAWQKTYDSDYTLNPTLHSRFGPNVSKAFSPSHGWQSTSTNRTMLAQTPNLSSMSPKHFRQFLAQLRRSRHRFKAFMEAEIENNANKTNTKLSRSRPVVLNEFNIHLFRSNLIPTFLKNEASQPFNTKGSTKLLPNPHHNASLSYSHTPDLMNKILHSPVPGRIFSSLNTRVLTDSNVLRVGVAGLLGNILKGDALARQPTKLSDQQGHSVPIPLRVKRATLSTAPRVVNSQNGSSGFKENQVHLEFIEDARLRAEMTNPYPPGSQAYIEHYDTFTDISRGSGAPMKAKSQQRKSQARMQRQQPKHQRTHRQKVNEMLSMANNQSANYNLD